MSALPADAGINLFGGRESLREGAQMIASESGPRQRTPEKMPRNGAERGLTRRLSFASQFAPRANARTLRAISHDSSVRSGNSGEFRDLLADRDGFELALRFVRHMSRKTPVNLPPIVPRRKAAPSRCMLPLFIASCGISLPV